MKVIRGLRISARQLGAHRTRTALALLGIVIGVSSVIAMVAVGHGARQDVMARIDAMGTDLIMVPPAQVRSFAGRARARSTVTTLTPDDAAAIIRLTALRYAVLVVSPDPISYQAAAAGTARRIARAERLVLIHRLKHAGIPVVDWDTNLPFETAVSGAIGQIRTAWRRRSR